MSDQYEMVGDLLVPTALGVLGPDTNYKGASQTAKQMRGFNPRQQSPDSEISQERRPLTDRSFDTARNNPVIKGGLRTKSDNVIGTGLRVRSMPKWRVLGKSQEWADEFSERAESIFEEFASSPTFDAAGKLDFYEMTSQTFYYSMMCGEYVALPLWLKDRGSFKTAIQMVEPDRLMNPNGRPNSDDLRDGVVLNRYGEHRSYWFARRHPGDTSTNWNWSISKQWQRVPAKTPFGRPRVLHGVVQKRAGQTRGIPGLATILEPSRMGNHYKNVTVQKQIIGNMIAAFIETPLDQETILQMFGGKDAKGRPVTDEQAMNNYLQAKSGWQAALSPGAIIPMMPGDKLSGFMPSQTDQNFSPFMEIVNREIAVGFDMPYEMLLKDVSKTSWSAVRALLVEFWRHVATERQWTVSKWAQPVYGLCMEEAISRGDFADLGVTIEDFMSHKHAYLKSMWTGPGRGWVDPSNEAQAAGMRIGIGVSTLERECAEQGLDYRDVIEQLGKEKRLLAEHDVTLGDVMSTLGNSNDSPDDGDGEPKKKGDD